MPHITAPAGTMWALLFLFSSLIVRGSSISEITTSGCPCVTPCTRTIDSLAQPWCQTSASPVAASALGCGPSYSPTLQAYWDYCQLNITSTPSDVVLTTFPEMWSAMTISTVAAMSGVYAVAGCTATMLTSPQRTIYWLPCFSAMIGAFHGIFVGGISAMILAFLYLSIPYALDSSVAVSLGLAVAVFVTYSALGRHRRPALAMHASEYGD